MNKPYFSIITPTYNCINYLKECIKSINEQAFQSFEHIIIDDGSSDQTKDFLLKNKTKRQKLIFINHSGLPGIARNIGLKNSSAKFIAFLDSDDIWNSEKLKNQLEIFKKSNFGLVCSNMAIIDENKNIISEKHNDPSSKYNNISHQANRRPNGKTT